MAQMEVNLRDIYRVLRRRKWVIIAAPILMGVATFIFTKPPAPVYEAKTLVKVSRSSILSGLMVDYYLTYSPYDNMSTQILVVTSRPVLGEVARRLNLGEEESVVDKLKGQITAQQQGNSDVLEIAATAPSPEQAIVLANTAADAYISQSNAEKYKRIDEAANFIASQLAEITQEARQAEEELSSFKQANSATLAMNPAQGVDIQEKRFLYQQKIQDIRGALATLARIEQTKEYYEAIQLDEPSVRVLMDDFGRRSGIVTDLRNRRNDLLRYQKEGSPQVAAVSAQLRAEETRMKSLMAALSRRLRQAQAEYGRLDRTLAQQQAGLNQQPILLRELDRLQTNIREKQDLAVTMRKRLQEAEIQQKEKVDDITFVERAQSAGRALETTRYYQALIGVLVGILLGGVFAFVLESLDTSIGTIEDVEEYIGSPVLGVIPHIEADEVKSHLKLEDFPPEVTEDEVRHFARLVTHFAPKSIAAEAYRTLRTNVASALAGNRNKQTRNVLLLTSSVLQEGKTTSSCNLAVAFAQNGQRVLLIDADLRRPHTDKLFGVRKVPGLVDVLFGTHNLKECCRTVEDFILGKFGLKMAQLTPGMGFLYLLPAGRSTENPSEILNSPAMDKLLAEVRENFDIVILDTSPVLPVADASILSPKVDGVIVSYQIGRIGREALKRSKLRLETLGATVMGIIMNDIQAEIDYRRSDYYYEYHYRYEPASAPEETLLDRIKSHIPGLRPPKSPPKSRPQPPSKAASPPRTQAKTSPVEPPPSVPSAQAQEMRDIMGLTDDKRS